MRWPMELWLFCGSCASVALAFAAKAVQVCIRTTDNFPHECQARSTPAKVVCKFEDIIRTTPLSEQLLMKPTTIFYDLSWWQPAASWRGHRAYTLWQTHLQPESGGRYYAQAAALTTGK